MNPSVKKPETHDFESAAIIGIREYAQKYHNISTQAAKRIGAYSDALRVLVADDARRRYLEILAGQSKALLAADYAPSLLELAQVELGLETRHSLVLASLLDPSRTGPLAGAFWSRLIERLRILATGDKSKHESVSIALGRWHPEMLDHLEVWPSSHGAEWHKIDVFARVEDKDGYLFGLVIENKVIVSTEEQDKQLFRYWTTIRKTFDPVSDRTVFLFLTESPRSMKTAGVSVSFWLQLEWSGISDLLLDISADESLGLGDRLVAAHYRDSIDSEILGRPTLAEERRTLRKLHLVLENRPADDPVWASNYLTIVDLWSKMERSKE